jgi:hypothetical protein
MSANRQRRENRAGDRPRTGDALPCPFCRAGSIVFTTQYHVDDTVTPAWVCENPECGYRIFARHSARTRDAHVLNESVRAAKQRSARARRTVMKSVARVDRSLRRIERTEERIARHTKSKS